MDRGWRSQRAPGFPCWSTSGRRGALHAGTRLRLLERAWRTYRGDGVLFVGVDIQDSEAEARSYVRQYDITYPNGLDTDGKITIDYGVIGLPVTFFVDSSGIVRRRWVGAIDATTLDAWLNELIRGTARQGGSEGENLERFFELERR